MMGPTTSITGSFNAIMRQPQWVELGITVKDLNIKAGRFRF
ncbi:MAG: hypothetical protein AAF549_08120 [Pseudomonadota bacterium]